MHTTDLASSIGHTPLIKLKKLSALTGCEIFGKAEFLNPGGSIKDRTALGMIQNALLNRKITPGCEVFEGTAGNTGIGLAMLAPYFDFKCKIVMPDNQAQEKYQTLEAYGAEVIKVPPCPFANQNHFYHTARRLSEASANSYWCNQFENTSNFEIHYSTTAQEIFAQSQKKINHFCAASGTGGSLAGISSYLKEQDREIKITLLDPFGSGLYEHFKTGEMITTGSSITEGIGIMRLTENFKRAKIDSALKISDQEMISMLYFVARHEGLLIGTSAALNLVGAFKIALQNKNSGQRIFTLLCDSALRYQSKIFSKSWLQEKGLTPKLEDIEGMLS